MTQRYEKTSQSRQTGFTLIEMLVAVAIMASVAAISYATLNQYLLVRERLAQQSEALQKLQKLFILLDRDLRFAVNRPVRDELGEVEAALSIDADSALAGELLRLTVSAPDTFNPGLASLSRVAWRLQDGVMFRDQYAVLDRDFDSEPAVLQVIEGVESIDMLSFEWSDESGLQQLSEWQEEALLPYGLELNITMDDQRTFRRLFDLANGS